MTKLSIKNCANLLTKLINDFPSIGCAFGQTEQTVVEFSSYLNCRIIKHKPDRSGLSLADCNYFQPVLAVSHKCILCKCITWSGSNHLNQNHYVPCEKLHITVLLDKLFMRHCCVDC